MSPQLDGEFFEDKDFHLLFWNSLYHVEHMMHRNYPLNIYRMDYKCTEVNSSFLSLSTIKNFKI